MQLEFLRGALGANNINLPDDCVSALCRLADLLVEFNAHTNITSIVSDEGIALDHFIDSLLPLDYFPRGCALLDVGAGGGFPSLPIAICRPDITVTALDSTAKKLTFIQSAAAALSLNNISTLPLRAEDAAALPEYREKFDVVTARAVAKLNILDELCIPFISRGGKFFAYKGRGAPTEYDEAAAGIEKLGGIGLQTLTFEPSLASAQRLRFIIIIEKTRSTPLIYPRPYSKILKKPL